jgi:hypothetical protein
MKTIIDISRHTTLIDPSELKKFDGVYIKATEGKTYISPSMELQIDYCRKYNVPFGLYHFAGKVYTAKEEFAFFKSIVNKYPDRTLPDCLDYEQHEESLQFIKEFMSYDKDLIFYSYRTMCSKSGIPKNKIWVAIPSLNKPQLNSYLGIQYLLSHDVGKIKNCDVSVFDDSIFPIKTETETKTNDIKEIVKMRVIKLGENSKRVLMVQSILNIVVNAHLKLDGYFGNNTYEAVQDYQSINKLEVDGIVGSETINSLLSDITKILK